MNILNESTWLKPDGIAKMENMYNAKYVFESCLKTKWGWSNFPVAIFYTETPHPEGSNYFGLYRTDFGDLMITNGISATTEPFDALQVDDDIIYSRYRHDYREHKGAMVDGGRDYFKHNMTGTPVKLQVVGDHLEIVDDLGTD